MRLASCQHLQQELLFTQILLYSHKAANSLSFPTSALTVHFNFEQGCASGVIGQLSEFDPSVTKFETRPYLLYPSRSSHLQRPKCLVEA